MQIQLTSNPKPNYYNYNVPSAKSTPQPTAKPADEYVPSAKTEESGFFTTKPTISGNIKKFAPPMIAGGLLFGTLVGATVGNPLLGAGVGTAFGTVSGLLYGAGRPTGN